MSLRPRFAGEGRLVLPSDITVVRASGPSREPGDVLAALDGEQVDPFERDADDLLLAEAFARVDLSRPRLAREWYLAHGAVALRWLFGDATRPLHWVGTHPTSQDTQAEVLAQQRLVRWHLTSLARLSAHRPGVADQGDWDPTWASAVIEGPDGQGAWLGAPLDVEASFSPRGAAAAGCAPDPAGAATPAGARGRLVPDLGGLRPAHPRSWRARTAPAHRPGWPAGAAAAAGRAVPRERGRHRRPSRAGRRGVGRARDPASGARSSCPSTCSCSRACDGSARASRGRPGVASVARCS